LKVSTKALAILLLGLSSAALADETSARENYGRELAGCSAFYLAGAGQPGLNEAARKDLNEKSHTALMAAARVTNNQYALTKRAEAQASPGTVSGGLCDQIMAHPNERFAYWRSR
jgi:hypothetical protein